MTAQFKPGDRVRIKETGALTRVGSVDLTFAPGTPHYWLENVFTRTPLCGDELEAADQEKR